MKQKLKGFSLGTTRGVDDARNLCFKRCLTRFGIGPMHDSKRVEASLLISDFDRKASR